jgi:hypothetical protein
MFSFSRLVRKPSAISHQLSAFRYSMEYTAGPSGVLSRCLGGAARDIAELLKRPVGRPLEASAI